MDTKNRSAALLKGLPGNRRSTQLREALSQAGVHIDGSGRGRIKTKAFSASVVQEPGGFITVRADVDGPADPMTALEMGTHFRGNARFALVNSTYCLAAETRVDGVDHLPDSLDEIQRIFRSVSTSRQPRWKQDDAIPDAADAVRRAVTAQGWTSEQRVETDYGWELQPRLSGQTVPVQVRVEKSGIRVTRCVLSSLPHDTLAGRAVAHQALLFNARLRFSRLAVVEGQLVVDARLRAGLIDHDWLDFSSRAAASAAAGVTSTMRVLAEEDVLSRQYAEMFLDA